MDLPPPHRLSAVCKVAALAIVLCVGAGVARMLWLRGPGHRITDREVLQEAVAEWQRAGKPFSQGAYQIFEQQAAQGHYDDAAATGHLFRRPDDVRWSVVELAKIRAENGDIQGAKSQIKKLAGSDVGAKAAEAIALAQAYSGDLRGALETITPLGTSNEVLWAFARRQMAQADFDGALKTAEQMDHKSAVQTFYGLADALREQGEQRRLHELASHMSNRKLSSLFVKVAQFTFRPHEIEVVEVVRPGPCDLAYHGPSDENFAAVDASIEQNKCSYVSFVATQQYAVDPAGAERLLRRNANPQDLAFGLDQFAVAAAKKGNIAEALRLLADLQRIGTTEKNVVLAQTRNTDAVHEIARDWTIRDGPKTVLKWARSRPNADERVWAFIGVAEALGHARPHT
ncbi:MAG: hypothetical protein WCC99_16295 [Candidatus Sulfotelmatobacter sp.]